MSDVKLDGGPAFPKSLDPYPNLQGKAYPSNNHGMSLRDWFAGQALSGLDLMNSMHSFEVEMISKKAYLIADAILKLREEV